MTDKKQQQAAREVVKLTDIAPRQDVKGGSQRRVFGSDPVQGPVVDRQDMRRGSLKAPKAPAKKTTT